MKYEIEGRILRIKISRHMGFSSNSRERIYEKRDVEIIRTKTICDSPEFPLWCEDHLSVNPIGENPKLTIEIREDNNGSWDYGCHTSYWQFVFNNGWTGREISKSEISNSHC